MSEQRKTIEEWSKEYETVVMDADGFPKGFEWETTLLTRKEFLQGMMGSTIQFGPKINQALDNLKYMD